MRVLTFAAVIAVHATAVGTAASSVGAGAVLMLLHATREAFFVLTAFVLVLRWAGQPLPYGSFVRRRFLLIGLPYLVWSLLYAGLFGDDLRTTVLAVLTGTAEYHLYFLLVSLQFAVLFPLLRGLLARTRGHHGLLLAGAAALQFVVDALLHADPGAQTWAGVLAPTYVGWFVGGGLLALHRDRVRRALAGRGALVALVVLTTGALAEAAYLLAVHDGTTPAAAADVFHPAVALWSAAAVVGMWTLGEVWSGRAGGVPTGRGAAAVRYGSDRSFGVFLAHPMLMYLATVAGSAALLRDLPGPVVAVVLYAVGAVGSLVVVAIARRTPLCLALTGKSRPPRRNPCSSTRRTPRPPSPSVPASPARAGGRW
ncbi:acyltransferase [Actinomycetospora sp. NBRC 106378]|uniref:acyltransferase n=1 Tax=Actinomycetospora sp. NBRC 106378 TaxID=3032208 RepID=UPI0024A0FE98|nr:acyltransferase [Actinomycetospora sp. NBRC 106378]GLZ51956.1 acyltransferase [Actinomycetospora sp. NBRC 106378]